MLELDPTVVEAAIEEQEMADEDVDDTHQHLITEYVCADIDPELVNDDNDGHPPLPNISNENDGENNCDFSITAMIDEIHSKMAKIYDWRSGEERMIRKGSSIVALSQVALYFTQKHCMLLKDGSDHFRGYRGLVHRCHTKYRNEKHTMADKAESLAVFLYQKRNWYKDQKPTRPTASPPLHKTTISLFVILSSPP